MISNTNFTEKNLLVGQIGCEWDPHEVVRCGCIFRWSNGTSARNMAREASARPKTLVDTLPARSLFRTTPTRNDPHIAAFAPAGKRELGWHTCDWSCLFNQPSVLYNSTTNLQPIEGRHVLSTSTVLSTLAGSGVVLLRGIQRQAKRLKKPTDDRVEKFRMIFLRPDSANNFRH